MKYNWIRRLRNPEIRAIIENNTLTTGQDHDSGDLVTVWYGWGGIYELYTMLIVRAGLYHLYHPAIRKALENSTSHHHPSIRYKNKPVFLITNLRLGSNGFFPSDDRPYFEVPEELDGLEDAIKRELGEFVFSDEYAMCSQCYQPMRISPDSYGWQPNYIDDEDGYTHADCLSSEWLPEWMENNKGKPIPYAILKKINGLTTIEQPDHLPPMMFEYESGMHHGQDDDPNKMTAYLSDHGIDVWYEYDAGQFDVTWRPMVRLEDHDKAQQLLIGFDPYQGYSTAEEMKRALTTGQSTEHIKVTKSDHIPGTDIATDYTSLERKA